LELSQVLSLAVEIWLKDAGVSLRSKKVNIEDGIDLLRTHLKQHPITGAPGILVDPKCRGFIAECGGGSVPKDIEGGGIWMRDKNTLKPISRNNHACTALIYYLVNKFGYTGLAPRRGQMKISRKLMPRDFVRT